MNFKKNSISPYEKMEFKLEVFACYFSFLRLLFLTKSRNIKPVKAAFLS